MHGVSIPPHIFTRFVDDDKIAELKELELLNGFGETIQRQAEISPGYDDFMEWLSTDERRASLGDISSLADYCESLGANDPLYWQKVYTRLGLEYTSTSPRGNCPVFDGSSS